MTNEKRARIWDQLDELSDQELQSIVSSTTTVLGEISDDPAGQDYTTMPARVARAEIIRTLQEAGLLVNDADVRWVTEDNESSKQLSIALLRALGEQPTLAAEIEATHRARAGMMAIDPFTVSAVALLLFVLKLRRIKIGDSEVTFFEAKEGVLKTIRGLVGG